MFYFSSIDEIRKRNTLVKIKRNKQEIENTIKRYHEKCFMNDEHKTFKTVYLNNFVEVHHIIPLSIQNSFNSSLDSIDNMITLCPNCHRKIHLATDIDKVNMLNTIFAKKPELKKYISSKEDLYEIYCSDFNNV